MKQIKTISVLGAGWLGLYLGKRLLKEKFIVKGSTTNKLKLQELADNELQGYLIKLNPKISGEIKDFFLSDILILNIPPKRIPGIELIYPEIIEECLRLISEYNIKKVLFISSTSVYPSTGDIFTEDDHLIPDKPSGIALYLSEEKLRESLGDHLTILRFGGLIGYDRSPVKILKSKPEITNPEGYLNLIHRDDCIEIILQIIQKDMWGETYNAVADIHPKRRDWYLNAARKLEIEIPEFASDQNEGYKIISNKKIKSALDYSFIYPDPLQII
jgi:hypothetical protein